MKQKKMIHNCCFVDGQNLHLGTKQERWHIDFNKFRIYLRDKFKVDEAYYCLWFISEEEQDLYNKLQKAGFIVVFREHSSNLKGKKKGNVDVDIVFEIMRKIADHELTDKIVLVSWDGDYIKMINYLIKKDKLEKILFPNSKYSSLYKKIKHQYCMNLSMPDVKNKIRYKKEVS